MEKQLTVLVVDDEAMVRLFAKTFLDEANFNTLLESSADEPIEVLERRDDLQALITDVQMPGSMDGVRMANAVRDRWPPIVIIVISGQGVGPVVSPPEEPVFFTSRFGRRRSSALFISW
jgi:two-component system, response regulator PdtaR